MAGVFHNENVNRSGGCLQRLPHPVGLLYGDGGIPISLNHEQWGTVLDEIGNRAHLAVAFALFFGAGIRPHDAWAESVAERRAVVVIE